MKQLIVGDVPSLVLDGALCNSTSWSTAYMKPVRPRLKTLTLNTDLASVSWEMIEQTEGNGDETRHGLKVRLGNTLDLIQVTVNPTSIEDVFQE